MPWLSRNNFTPTDKLHSDDLNNLANDDRTWGGNVNGGGYTLSNVNIVAINPQAAGQVTSVFGRSGDVVAQNGDYTPAQVGAVPLARQVIAGSGMTGGGQLTGDVTLNAAVTSVFARTGAVTLSPADITSAGGVLTSRKINTATGSGLAGGSNLSADVNLSVVPDTTNQQIQVMSQGTLVGSPRSRINFVSGSGALVSVAEVSASNRIDVTIQSSGGSGGGFVDPTQIQGDLIVRGLTAPPTRLPIGLDGQVLTADHQQPQSVKWATPAVVAVTSVFNRTGAVVAAMGDYSADQITNAVDQTGSYTNPPWIASLPWLKITNAPAFLVDPTVQKGDLIVHATTTTRLPPGADGTILTADSSQSFGVRWGTVAVSSVFGRTGAVIAQAGDYVVGQVTGAVPNTITINTPPGSGLSGGGNLSSNRTFAVIPDTTNQQVAVYLGGAPIGTRHAINFISGSGAAVSVVDNTLNNWVDVTVASSGGGTGSGMADPTSAVGDLIVRGAALPAPPVRLPIGANGQVLTVDTTTLVGLKWAIPISGGGGSQSPWIGDVDAASHKLNNVAGIGANIAANPTIARVYALTNGTEDGFAAACNNSAGLASISVINDTTDSLRLRIYGSGYVGGLPNVGTLESSKPLAFLANAAEVMRLTSGRVLIGTTTDDGLEMLQVNGKIKSKTGGYVFPDGSTQTTAYTSASVPVTSVFTRTGAVVAVAGDYTAALVTNAVDSSSTYNNPSWITSLAWSKITGVPPTMLLDPTTAKGDLIARGAAGPATRLPASTTNGWVLTADSAQALGVKWAVPPGQTPWLSDIDAAGFTLKNTGRIGVGNTAALLPDTFTTNNHVIVGQTAATTTFGEVTVCTNITSSGPVGLINFANYGLTGTDKRVAAIYVEANATDTAYFAFFTNNLGTLSEKMRLTAAGNLGIGTTSPVNTAEIWTSRFGPPATSGAAADGTLRIVTTGHGESLDIGTMSGGAWIQVRNYTDYTARYALALNPNGGNVGIGTASPSAPLHVVGSVRVYGDANGLTTNIGLAQFAIGGASNGNKSLWLGFDTSSNVGVIQAGVAGSSWNGVVVCPQGGNVGIGTGGATTLLSLGTTLAPIKLAIYDGGSASCYGIGVQSGILTFGAGINPASGVPHMVITGPTGNVGIGTTTPNAQLHLLGSGQATGNPNTAGITGGTIYLQDLTGAAGNGGMVMFGFNQGAFAAIKGYATNGGGNSQGDLVFATRRNATDATLTEAMRIVSNGTVTVGGVAIGGGVGVYINGVNQGSAPAIDFFAGAQMQISLGGGPAGTIRVTFTCTASDLQLKRDVKSLAGGLPLITQLRPITAEWNGLAGTREGQRVTSVIAQELQVVIPDAVSPYRTKLRPEDEEEVELLSVDSMALTAHLILAIQQLEQRLKAIEQKVN